VLDLAVVVFPGIDEEEVGAFLGPLGRVTRLVPDRITAYTLARDLRPVTCIGGLQLLPHHSFVSAPAADIAMVCGGPGAFEALKDEDTLRFLRRLRKHAATIAGCNGGILPLAAAGLLQRRQVAAVGEIASLTSRATYVTPVDDPLVVDGPMLTAHGRDAAQRIALHLIAEIFGEITARALRDTQPGGTR
jgi:transcriptional regulator GlxA family with amidase domain